MSLTVGDLVDGKYRIVRLIGDGGMGSVYEARHELLGIPVALKFLHEGLAKRPGLSARFLQEARVSATIQSPHVARVTDVDTTPDGAPYLVMELLSGESLQALLTRVGRIGRDQAVDYGLQILVGLEAAHELSVVHRDLKPDNVFVTPSPGGPVLKLIDFGIAKLRVAAEYRKELTRAGVVMGTPEYMAPEQFYAAHEVDARADLYSLGVMLFEMLTGARPADGDTPEVIVGNVIAGHVKHIAELAPDLPESLVSLVNRALEPDRDRRFASAFAMRSELSRCAGELSAAGRAAATAARVMREERSVVLGTGTSLAKPQVPDTLDNDRPNKLPDTLPPDGEGEMPRRTGTQAAPPPHVWGGGASPAAPVAAQAPAPIPPAGVVPPPMRAATQRRRRSNNRALIWLGLSAVALIAGIGFVLSQSTLGSRRTVPDLPAFDVPATGQPATTPSVAVVPTTPATNPDNVVPERPPAGSPNPTSVRPRPPSTPAVGGPVSTSTSSTPSTPPFGTNPLPFPSIALPSSLPPLPSGFPTALPTVFPTALPTFLPQIPGLTVPGLTPAPGTTTPPPPAP
ncbi:MAG TPA: protein kinase [Polyangiaceae bacterium]|nr:protein kinase [Polyangiaceae bacterium]